MRWSCGTRKRTWSASASSHPSRSASGRFSCGPRTATSVGLHFAARRASPGQIADLGGIAAICLSHPHFYAANVEFADAFDARIFIPRADQHWIQRPSPRIELFDDDIEPVPGLTLARIGGHFDGAAVLHWPAGSGQRGALLTGDTITVVQDRDWVSFMWSFPNLIPLDQATVLDIARRVERFAFDRVYGGWWGRVVVEDGAGAVRRSADRYVARLNGQRPPQQAAVPVIKPAWPPARR